MVRSIETIDSVDSFGKVISQSNAGVEFRYGYTGREQDGETGLDYYRARYYDSAVGRFISEDPLGFGAGDGNLTRYVRNNAVNAIDRSGLITFAIPGGRGEFRNLLPNLAIRDHFTDTDIFYADYYLRLYRRFPDQVK